MAYYYPSNSEVSADSELQEWINEIFQYGFLGNADSGISLAILILGDGPQYCKVKVATHSNMPSCIFSFSFFL